MLRRAGWIGLATLLALVVSIPASRMLTRPTAEAITGDLPAVDADYLVFNDAGTYRVRKSLSGAVLGTSSSTDVGVVVNAAITDIGTGSGVIAFLSGTYNDKTKITLHGGVGLVGTGSEHAKSATRYTIIKAVAGFPATQPLVTTDGVGAFLRSIVLDGANLATSAFETGADEPRLDEVAFRGGTSSTVHVLNDRGTANLVDIRKDTGVAPTGLYIQSGADWNWVNTRVADGGYQTVVKVQGTGNLFSNAHFTGGVSTTTNTINDGDRNRFVNVYFDTVSSGPLFQNVSGHCSITGGWFRAATLIADNTYPMVKVTDGWLVLNGTQGEAGTNRFSYGIDIAATANLVTAVGNQFSDIGQATAWNTAPEAHAANTRNGVAID